MQQILRAGALLASVALIAACSGNGASAAPTTAAMSPGAAGSGAAASIDVTEADFKIEPSSMNAAPGMVTFHITNKGSQKHEFVVIKTDTAADQLPRASDGTEVDEEATGLTHVDEVENLEVGKTADLAVKLDAGHYVLICNVPGHYTLGMHTAFTVGS